MSGLSRTPGKRVWVYPHRGFESRLLRHDQNPAKTSFLVGFTLSRQCTKNQMN